MQAKHKAKDICLKPTGGHCDSFKKIQLALNLKTSHHWDWDSKPALGSEAKTHSEQTPAKDSKGNYLRGLCNKNKIKYNVYKEKKKAASLGDSAANILCR